MRQIFLEVRHAYRMVSRAPAFASRSCLASLRSRCCIDVCASRWLIRPSTRKRASVISRRRVKNVSRRGAKVAKTI